MKPIKNKGFFILSIIMVICITTDSFAKEVSRDEAKKIAMSVVNNRFPIHWTKNKTNISIQSVHKSDYPFYVCDVDGGGFVLVARDDRCPRVLGFSYESSFNPQGPDAPASLAGWIDAVKEACTSYINDSSSSHLTDYFPDQMPEYKTNNEEKTLFIPALMTTKWRVDSSFCILFPEGSILNSSAVIAMGQVFRYFEKPTTGIGEFCYLYGPQQEEMCTNFLFEFDFETISDVEADEQVTMLLFFMAMAGKLQFSGADLLTYRETLPAHFFYSDNMRKVEYWQNDFIPILKHQLSMRRPVPAEWKGHSFVIDGYYDTDFFHFNFGMGGEFDGYYFVDFPNVTTDTDHFLLSSFINYHPKSTMPVPEGLSMIAAGDSVNITWNINIPDSLSGDIEKYIVLRDGLIPVAETTSTSLMIHPHDLGISSEFNCIAVYNTYGASELSEPFKYISDYTISNIPSLELRQAVNIQLGYTEDLNRNPYVGELEMVKKLEIDFQDQRGIDQLTQLRHLFVDGLLLTGLQEGNYLNGLNYIMFHRCKQFDFTVLENTNSLNVIQGSDGLPYDFYDLRHNSDAGVIVFSSHDAVINNCCDLYGADKYFRNLSYFDVNHITYLFIDSCYVSYESYLDILPNIKGGAPALEHTSPGIYVPCYPSPARNTNVPNTDQISWQSNMNDDPGVFYNVYIGKTRDQLALEATFQTSNIYEYNFENNIDYYWRVEAFHNDTTYYSGIYHFSTYESFPMPFIENFDDYYARADVSFESPFWIDFGEELLEPAMTSRTIKRSGRYSLEFGAGSDAGIVFEPYADSSYLLEFNFRNSKAEFGIELLQGSNFGDTLAINSRIGLFGDNLGVFDHGESSEQFFFIPNDWNSVKMDLNMPSGLGILTINEVEIARWNWNIQKDGAANTNPFQGIRFSNSSNTGSAFIDDIDLKYLGATGINEVFRELPFISYSPLYHQIIIHDDIQRISGIELFDLRGRKITTFACNGGRSIQLDEHIPNGVLVVVVKGRDGILFSRKISIVR